MGKWLWSKKKDLIERIKLRWSKEQCYKNMEGHGIAAFGMCGGHVGGDKNTGYLSYDCIDCPYFVGFGMPE